MLNEARGLTKVSLLPVFQRHDYHEERSVIWDAKIKKPSAVQCLAETRKGSLK